MAIPKLKDNNELPAGEHLACLKEIELAYGVSTERRKELMEGLRNAASNLETAGVRTIWINGSFVTNKKEPNDIDGCWEYNPSVNINILDPVFLGDRAEMKKNTAWIFLLQIILRLEADCPFRNSFKKTGMVIQKALLL